MKKSIGCLIILVSFSCALSNEEISLDGNEVLSKSILTHDPNDKWKELEMNIHIQEPRTGNPSRYSIVKMNNMDQSFELIRNRENHLSKHVIDKNGISKVYLDDKEEIAPELIEKYRLNPERNTRYKDFYKMLYGLPMSLNTESINQFGEVESSIYNNQDCYKIPIELKQEMFSKNWIIYISKTEFEFKGMEIVFPENKTKGERLFFDGSISIKGVKVPRIRHWYELADNSYSGSDIIIGEL
ncbi:MAG: DUF6503 family protein [Saprospiraceae bacterium]